jgi:4-hydroxybenzoate polyprenyltransferase
MTASSAPAAPAARPSGSPVRGFLRLVTIEHSVFALPFAYLAALSAMYSLPPASAGEHRVRWGDLLLITIAMVAARTFAMAANRIIDREIDARNPRTAKRDLVTGAVSMRTALTGALVALGIFLLAAGLLSALCLTLAPLAVVPLVVYPYAKRFTWAPHAILALAQTVAPVGSWIAVTGSWSWSAVVLGLAVGTWIGGFDIIYACQDVLADRGQSVRSLPARFGVRRALLVARVVHVVTFGLFVAYGAVEGFGGFWLAGLVVTGTAFVYEHTLVRPDDLSKVNRAFFTVNGFVGVAMFCFALADLVSRGLRW